MILRLAWRSLLAHPVRTAVLAGGFGLGVAVMAALLGIGGVILDQARSPELVGGGDVVIGGVTGKLTSAPFVLSGVLGAKPLASDVRAAAPSARGNLYLIDDAGSTLIRVRGGVPSLERAMGDSETSGVAAWADTAADRRWSAPDAGEVLRSMDRFHPVPDVPARAASWAEWLYFNGRAGDTRFYLTFMAGPRTDAAMRPIGVRLQLERDGRMTAFGSSGEMADADLLASAPDLTVGRNTVRLVGHEYRITFDLPAEKGGGSAAGEIRITADTGRSLPPFALRGAAGWVSGYVVPVMSGALDGSIVADGTTLALSGGTGYHDHNWGFWEGVSWQWGQVQGGGLSFVYGRVRPPADAADASRIPGFLIALGPDGPVGYTTDVTIDETNRAGETTPEQIHIRARGDTLDLSFDLAVEQATTTKMRPGMFGSGLDFLQLRATYRVTGRAAGQEVSFTAPGSAETFRGR